jgi:hypothetical protein
MSNVTINGIAIGIETLNAVLGTKQKNLVVKYCEETNTNVTTLELRGIRGLGAKSQAALEDHCRNVIVARTKEKEMEAATIKILNHVMSDVEKLLALFEVKTALDSTKLIVSKVTKTKERQHIYRVSWEKKYYYENKIKAQTVLGQLRAAADTRPWWSGATMPDHMALVKTWSE